MTHLRRTRLAWLVGAAVSGAVFGSGSLLPLWWVPSWGVSVEHAQWEEQPGVLIRSGALWGAVVGTSRLPELGDRPWWLHENLVLTLVLLATSVIAGSIGYGMFRAGLSPRAVSAPPPARPSEPPWPPPAVPPAGQDGRR
jgi:hypothetical protein